MTETRARRAPRSRPLSVLDVADAGGQEIPAHAEVPDGRSHRATPLHCYLRGEIPVVADKVLQKSFYLTDHKFSGP